MSKNARYRAQEIKLRALKQQLIQFIKSIINEQWKCLSLLIRNEQSRSAKWQSYDWNTVHGKLMVLITRDNKIADEKNKREKLEMT